MPRKRIPALPGLLSPFDDPLFRALAEMHGFGEAQMPARILSEGWDARRTARRATLPEAFPEFVFNPDTEHSGAVLVIYFDGPTGPQCVRYGRNPTTAWLHLESEMLPETLKGSLLGRAVGAIADLRGLESWIVLDVQDETGVLSLRIYPKETPP